MTSKVKNLINKNYTYIGLDYGTKKIGIAVGQIITMDARPLKVCLLYTSPSPRDNGRSRMPSSA